MLKDLSIWQRLALIALTPSVTITALLVIGVTEQMKILQSVRQAEAAATYALALKKIFASLEEHRAVALVSRSGDAQLKEQEAQKRVDVDTTMLALAELDQQLGARLGTGERVRVLAASWSQVKLQLQKLERRELVSRYSVVIGQVLELLELLAHATPLAHGPDLALDALAQAMVGQLPHLTDQLGQLRALAPGVISVALANGEGPGRPPDEATAQPRARVAAAIPVADQVLLGTLLATSGEALDEARRLVGLAARKDPRLVPPLDELSREAGKLLESLDRQVLQADRPEVDARAFYDQAGRACAVALALLDAVARAVDAGFQAHRSEKQLELAIWIALFVATSVIGQLSLLYIARSITVPLQALTSAAEKISLGELDIKIETDRKDEIGALAEQFSRMQASLRVVLSRME
jgi:methyl-accepting chemotaxis protein